jgi:2'-5' RNA ligase
MNPKFAIKMKKRIYNQTALFGPLYAYLVVLSPPDEVKTEIARIKKELNEIADITERNLHSIAHITLTDKLTDDVDFAETISGLITAVNPFTIKVNGWDVFDHGHSVTIYLKIENQEPIITLMSLVKSPSKSPHISLAKKIPHETFDKLRPYLDNLTYSAEWVCNEVNVLRKLMSEKHLGFRESFVLKLS